MERLINKTKELKNYEKKFNLLKSSFSEEDNSLIKTEYINYTNYINDDYLLNFYMNKINKLNVRQNIYKLLRYELDQMKFDSVQIKNINELQNKITYFLTRYNFIIKDIIEDNWTIYQKESNQIKYELKDDEFVYDNSILIKNKEDTNLIYFIKKIYKLIRILAQKINYKVYTKFYDDEYHEICWLLFVFAKN